jgi:hypothetical protein
MTVKSEQAEWGVEGGSPKVVSDEKPSYTAFAQDAKAEMDDASTKAEGTEEWTLTQEWKQVEKCSPMICIFWCSTLLKRDFTKFLVGCLTLLQETQNNIAK